MNIRVVENEQDFLSIKEDWEKLAENLITVNSFEWMYKWWEHNKKGNELKILVAEKTGHIVGIAPLYIKNIKTMKLIKLRRLSFLGGKVSDYLDFLIEKGQDRELIFESLLNYALDNLDLDILKLNQINSHYPNFDLWQKYTENLRFEMNVHKGCPRINLLKFQSYDDYYTHLTKNQKKDIRRIINKANKEMSKVEYVFKQDITEEDIDIIADINIKRQKHLYENGDNGRYCFFTDRKKREFIKDYFTSGNPDSKILTYVKFGDDVVAYDLMLLSKDGLSVWNGAFDPNFREYSPAKLLLIEQIKYAFDNNLKYFDFMRGTDSYKLEWTNDMTVNYDIVKKKSSIAKLAYLYKTFSPQFLLPQKYKKEDIKLQLNQDLKT